MSERVYMELSDGREGWYIVTEEHPDGSLVVVPDMAEKTHPRSEANEDAQPGDDPETLSAYRAEGEEIELGFGAPIPEW